MDQSPTSLFDSYESDFKQIIASIREELDGDAKGEQTGTSRNPPRSLPLSSERCIHCVSVTEQRKAALRRVEMELDEADEMVRRQLPCVRMLRTKSDTNASPFS